MQDIFFNCISPTSSTNILYFLLNLVKIFPFVLVYYRVVLTIFLLNKDE